VSLTNILIAINVVAYVWLTSTGGLSSDRALVDHGALYGVAVLQNGEWWRIVTGAFLHGSIAHIALNMFALYQVGNIVEEIYGKVRFALIYAVALVGSGLAVVFISPNQPTVGASGAIFGLFGALVAVGLRMGPQGRGLIGQVLPVIIINLVFTFAIPNISASGHIGGLITGFLAGLVFYMMPRRREYAYAVAPGEARGDVETIEHPPAAGPHEGGPPLEVRDPRE
jgi:rhomboid protease GluP